MKSNASRPKILFISSPQKEKCLIREALKNSGFDFFEAKSSDSGVQKTMEYKPDLVICQNELDGYNGFQVYNLLKDTLAKHGILFFIYSDQLDKEDILIGLEMGVDNFILSPVDEKNLVDKIERQLHRIKEFKWSQEQKFTTYFDATPVAKCIIVNNQIVRSNEAFRRLLQLEENNEGYHVNDVFDFAQSIENAMNFRKCMNGFVQHCRMGCVPSSRLKNLCFDVHLQYDNIDGKGQLFAEVVPSGIEKFLKEKIFVSPEVNGSRRNRMVNADGLKLTRREKQVLELSSQGYPIKQIAGQLELSQRTIEKHRANIMQKTKTSSMIEAIYKMKNRSSLQYNLQD